MDLASIAAFTAAALSLISVIISVVLTYRLSRHAQLERWRHEEERPLVARLLRLSDDAVSKWLDTNHARMDWENSLSDDPNQNSEAIKALHKAIESWQAGSDLHDKIGFEAAQLDLIAGHPLRDVATKLVRSHWIVMVLNHPERELDDWYDQLAKRVDTIMELQKDLVEKARIELGADRGSEPRLRSAWRRRQARRKLASLRRAYPTFNIERRARHQGFVVAERATGKRVIIAKTIDSLEHRLIERQLAKERGESPGLIQEL